MYTLVMINNIDSLIGPVSLKHGDTEFKHFFTHAKSLLG